METKKWGANIDAWRFFARECPTEVLPVVANPHKVISERSSLKKVGKVPSVLDQAGQVIGLRGWTKKTSSIEQLRAWVRNPDYGISIQTRQYRCVDVDLVDAEAADEVMNAIVEWALVVGCEPWVRWRGNSSKFLVCFKDEGTLSRKKRVLHCNNGAIELLGEGNQFVAAGTHESGATIYWSTLTDFCNMREEIVLYCGEDEYTGASHPDYFCTVSHDELADLWQSLQRFGVESSKSVSFKPVSDVLTVVPDAEHPDPVLRYLHQKGMVRGYGERGRVDIICPFQENHTSSDVVSATSYWPAGSQCPDGGLPKGAFRCLHAHCSDATNIDFLNGIGYSMEGFDYYDDIFPELKPQHEFEDRKLSNDPVTTHINDLEVYFDYTEPLVKLPKPSALVAVDNLSPIKLPRDKNGKFAMNTDNLLKIFERPSILTMAFRYDAFRDEILVNKNLRPLPTNPNLLGADQFSWERITENDYTLLQRRCDMVGGKNSPSIDAVRRAVAVTAKLNTVDSAQDWLRACKWDGIPRVEHFCQLYLGMSPLDATDHEIEYRRAVGRYIWTAMAARIMDPGCKVEMMPILIGKQGCGKSTVIGAMSPHETYRIEIDLAERDADLARMMKGVLIAEVSELRGLSGRDRNSTKAFLSRDTDCWVPKYVEMPVEYKRRVFLVGSTNDTGFLDDPTGHRRFLPLDVGQCDGPSLSRDIGMLYAEALHLYQTNGIMFRDAERLAEQINKRYIKYDNWTTTILRYLTGNDKASMVNKDVSKLPREVEILDILIMALNIQPRHCRQGDQERAYSCLTQVGYVRAAGQRGASGIWVLKE